VGDGCKLASHVVIKAGVEMGAHNQISEGTVIGGDPQFLKVPPELGKVIIGSHNVIRENVTIHRSHAPDKQTIVGNHTFVMGGSHIAHDSHVEDHVIMAQGATLGGHVHVETRAFVSGLVAIHQFCRVGKFAMIGGLARVVQDVPPYVMIDGTSHRVVGLNRVGLKRNGYTTADFIQLKAAYRLIYRSGLRWVEVLERLKAEFPEGPAAHFHAFLSKGTRGFVHERRTPKGAVVRLEPDAANAEPGADEGLRVRTG
jgi:UDP-N-acetylglucosamine acyltransferase